MALSRQFGPSDFARTQYARFRNSPGGASSVPGGGGIGAGPLPPRDVGPSRDEQIRSQVKESLLKSVKQGGGAGTISAPAAVQTPVPPPAVAQIAAPTVPSGTNAAMLRAKERAGQLARSSVSGLRAVLGERGMLGSGVEGRATTNIATEALKQISDVNREQAIKEADQAARFAELGYQGAITQRGQDITMRGQDIGAQQAAAGRAQSQYQTTLQAMLDALRAQLY